MENHTNRVHQSAKSVASRQLPCGQGSCFACGRCYRAGQAMEVSAGAVAEAVAAAQARWLEDAVLGQAPAIVAGEEQLELVGEARSDLLADEETEKLSLPGVAVDVGTTTLVARLYDERGVCVATSSRPNPQAQFGADVISRIAHASRGGLEEMHLVLWAALRAMIEELLQAAGWERDAARWLPLYLCGNTVMEHIGAGVNPTPIGQAPFTPPYAEDFPGQPEGATWAPCVAGFVGGDIVCDLLALDAPFAASEDGPALLLDLGTNGEMALWDGKRIIACATAAGPVFEGAQIACGMPAYEGAISRVWRDEAGALQVEVIGDAPPEQAKGICGSGLVDAIALMLTEGIIDTRGRWVDKSVAASERRFWLTPQVYVTQKDVRAFQLAKGAIRAGIEVLLAEAGYLASELSRVYIAGGMSTHLNGGNAARLGLIPKEALSRTQAVGNCAIEGASLALRSVGARQAAKDLAKACAYLELSGNKVFDERYLRCMDF